MPATVSDDAVNAAATALLAAARTISTPQGMRIRPQMDLQSAKQHVMCALVFALGHPAHSLQLSGWLEIGQPEPLHARLP